jgi:hypothetical protein
MVAAQAVRKNTTPLTFENNAEPALSVGESLHHYAFI